MLKNENIAEIIYSTESKLPGNLAIVAGSDSLSYSGLGATCRRVAAKISPRLTHGRCGVLGTRSVEACVAIVGIAWAGGTYVPISLKYPEQRLVELLDMLELDVLIVDRAGLKLLSETVRKHCPALLLVPAEATGEFDAEGGEVPETPAVVLERPVPVGAGHLAYIEFTSGTTGKPKGVMVSTRAVASYIEAMRGWYDFGPGDRAAETCDITFDLSVHNMLMTWQAGACLYIMPS